MDIARGYGGGGWEGEKGGREGRERMGGGGWEGEMGGREGRERREGER